MRPLVWLLLALPAMWFMWRYAHGELALDLERPSGETAVRLLILALLPGPLAEALGRGPVLSAWLALRRNIGVAAFLYALLHLAFYLADAATPAAVAEDLPLPGIWTGWLALALMVPPAAISFDAALRALGRRWRQVQYLVYAVLGLALAHWLLLDSSRWPIALHLVAARFRLGRARPVPHSSSPIATEPDMKTTPLRLAAAAALCLTPGSALADGEHKCNAGPPSAWKPIKALNKAAFMEGWTVLKTEVTNDCYEVYARTENGQVVEAFFHPATLKKLIVYRRGKEVFRAPGFTG